MNPKLTDLITRMQSKEPFDARGVQREISALWDELDVEEDRVTLLAVHKSVMDLIERSAGISGEALKRFQGAREGEYRLFLMKEAMLDDENVDPAELDRITAREVAAGRMSAESEYREFARTAEAVLGSPQRGKSGWLGRLFK